MDECHCKYTYIKTFIIQIYFSCKCVTLFLKILHLPFLACGPWHNIDKRPCRIDRETISDVRKFGITSSAIDCPTSYIIQGKVDNTIFYSGSQGSSITGERVWFTYRFPPNALTGAGLTSFCKRNGCKGCKDYSVRFCCPKNSTENNEGK